MNKVGVKAILATMLILPAIALAGCGAKKEDGKQAQYQKITAEEAKERMDSGEDVLVLDVRTKEEYADKHIEDAVLIPNETIDEEKPKELPDLDQEILVYCRSWNRSAQAAKKLLQMGYTNVYDFGGIHDWPYETEKR